MLYQYIDTVLGCIDSELLALIIVAALQHWPLRVTSHKPAHT